MAKKCKDADTTITSFSESLQLVMDKNKTDALIVIGKKRAEFVNPFVLLFYDNLDNIIRDYNLTGVDIRILLKIMKKMQNGNLLSISFAQIGKETGIAKPNVYRTKKKFLESQLLVELNGELYVNPHVIAKGDYADNEQNKNSISLVNDTYTLMQGNDTITESINTSTIKKMKKQTKKVAEQKMDDKDILSLIEENNPLKKAE